LGSIVIGRYFFHCDTQYNTDQTAVGTVHMITILTSVVQLLSADDARESGEGVECKLYIVISIEFWGFTGGYGGRCVFNWRLKVANVFVFVCTSLQYQYIAMLHTVHSSIGMGYRYH